MDTFIRYMAVAVGGALGAVARYFLGGTIFSRMPTPFPIATLVINVSGSFILGFFLTVAAEYIPLNPHFRLAVAVGFIGAYTTFSTFEYETLRLAEEHGPSLALVNIIVSVVIGFVAVWGGMAIAHLCKGAAPSSIVDYERFEDLADITDPTQRPGAERDIRDSSIVGRVRRL